MATAKSTAAAAGPHIDHVRFGYCRVPTRGQTLEVQLAALSTAGVADSRVFAEKRSGRSGSKRLDFSGQLISQAGTSFTFLALLAPPLLVFMLTGSATSLALTTAAEFLPYLLFGLMLGAVVDRLDRRRLMLFTAAGRAVVVLLLPVLARSGTLRVADRERAIRSLPGDR